jgi:uncharacterized protein
MDPKVYYMDARSKSPQTSLVAKMMAVFRAAGFEKIIKPGDVVAIKLHCGEWNNTAYLRPVYARALVDKIKSIGGPPSSNYAFLKLGSMATLQEMLVYHRFPVF